MSTQKWQWARSVDCGRPTWIAGLYKICLYDLDEQWHPIKNYRAYYRPPTKQMWGDHVEQRVQSYPTLKAAQAACMAHAKKG